MTDAPGGGDHPIRQLVPLGINGFYPSHGRQTMSFLVDVQTATGRVGLLLDAGTGTGRLAEPDCPVPLDELDRLEVVLSHYHLDHVAGLAALPAAFRAGGGRAPMRLWAPGEPLVDAQAVEALHQLIAPPLFPYRLDEYEPNLEIRPYGEASDLDDLAQALGLAIRVQRNRHPGGAVGLRFGDQLAYLTDTAPDPGSERLVEGVHTLLHEVWATADEAEANPRLLEGHCDTQAVRALAQKARVNRLVPVHHPPQRGQGEMRALHDELESPGEKARPGPDYVLHRPLEGQSITFAGADASSESAGGQDETVSPSSSQ